MLSTFLAALLHNQLFAGLGGAAVISGLMFYLRSIPMRIWHTFQHFFSVQLYVENTDPAYYWINIYLSQLPVAKQARTLRVNDADKYSRESKDRKWTISVGLGTTVFMKAWTLFVVHRNIQTEGASEVVKESINIRSYGRSHKPIKKIVEAALELANKKEKLRIHSYSTTYTGWGNYVEKEKRPLESVVINKELKDKLMADVHQFCESREAYARRGIPYHRGYLLSGPAGTGKTSLVQAIAGELGRDIAILDIGGITSNSMLQNAICDLPDNVVVALEDIDCASNAIDSRDDDDEIEDDSKSRTKKKNGKSSLTLSAVLNALDGILTPDNTIFFLTTNHPDRLDAALIRPGRVDLHIELSLLDTKEQKELSSLFYEESISREEPISPAKMQYILMANDNREDALKELNAA